MSHMTMYCALHGHVGDYHVMPADSCAAGRVSLVFLEQIAISPDGQTGTFCAGIWNDAQAEGLSRVTRMIKDVGSVPAIPLDHTGTKGSEKKPWYGKPRYRRIIRMDGRLGGPSAISCAGQYAFPIHKMTVPDIPPIHHT
jgi:2,4-dienoyl-CoA reductase-like NADH-dependent reductase (Old Yellow Enzyme family)